MIIQLLAIGLVLLFIIITSTLFLIPVISVIANTVVLYFLFLRIYTEIKKYKRGQIYLYAFPASCLLLVITGNFTPLWWITTASLVAFVIVQIYYLAKK